MIGLVKFDENYMFEKRPLIDLLVKLKSD